MACLFHLSFRVKHFPHFSTPEAVPCSRVDFQKYPVYFTKEAALWDCRWWWTYFNTPQIYQHFNFNFKIMFWRRMKLYQWCRWRNHIIKDEVTWQKDQHHCSREIDPNMVAMLLIAVPERLRNEFLWENKACLAYTMTLRLVYPNLCRVPAWSWVLRQFSHNYF